MFLLEDISKILGLTRILQRGDRLREVTTYDLLMAMLD
jgi:hypothetical protein